MVKQKMFQKNLILVVTLLNLPVFKSSSPAASGLIGSAAPYFRVQSGDDKELTLDMIKGKVAAIFYENKDIVDANKRLKDELNKLYSEQTDVLKDVLVRFPIIDCSEKHSYTMVQSNSSVLVVTFLRSPPLSSPLSSGISPPSPLEMPHTQNF